MGLLLKKIFGSRNERIVRGYRKRVGQINALEPTLAELSDEQLRAKTIEFREQLAQGKTLDAILPEAFAVVREAGRRVLGMRHFDVQMIGGMVLHAGRIAEMRTGEGKTLVATLAVYLNALAGKGVHVITVNDYLARRDASWMGRIYDFLGLSVGVINSTGTGGPDNSSFLFAAGYQPNSDEGYTNLRPVSRRESYYADITYGTNNEFGFDYLRDNMAYEIGDRVQRDPFYAVIDEVDSILIDEARTPLIISGMSEGSTELYQVVDKLVKDLKRQAPITNAEGKPDFGPGDYSVDEKQRQVYLSEEGHEHVEQLLMGAGLLSSGASLYDSANIMLMHHVYAAVRAHAIFHRNVDYIVNKGEVVIVDEFTGRTMPGRRWSDGLHQAVEAKEGLEIKPENQTLASITFQNLFRLYPKLSGMTGTADTEAPELQQIYGLEVVVVPTNKKPERKDLGDKVYLTQKEKFKAILEDVRDCQQRGQPVLVGTASIETSELMSKLLTDAGIKHEVLNAKQNEREAGIIAEAGRPGAVTIATNMAGRGTDIVLGGAFEADLAEAGQDADADEVKKIWQQRHDEVVALGGLHVVGTERHESRRIDNQLRGRSGRQGDPGSTRFYLSLEDNLMRIFASERIGRMMQRLGMKENEAIEHPWINKAIENAQRKVEGRNFDIRKQLLEYDDVANDQRKVIYSQRREIMDSEDVSDIIVPMREDVISQLIATYMPPESIEEMWDIPGLSKALTEKVQGDWPLQQWLDEDPELHEETLRERIIDQVNDLVKQREAALGADNMRRIEKAVLLQTLDMQWKDHLGTMDYLRQGIHLRGYAQKNPKQEYKREAFELFSSMLDNIKAQVVDQLLGLRLEYADSITDEPADAGLTLEYQHAEAEAVYDTPSENNPEQKVDNIATPKEPEVPKVGRNEPCPCGSGRKYKQCHGRIE